MAHAWMPGARRIRASSDGGMMAGGAPRVVWLTLAADPRALSVISAAQRLLEQNRPCHLLWDPRGGVIAQLLPVVRAGRVLGTREHLGYQSGGEYQAAEAVNREGRLCVQIAVLSSAREPFTSYPMDGLDDILGWLDSWNIPRRWPAGQPAPFRHGGESPRSQRLWSLGGHYGASQVPGCTSAGPGRIDIGQLTRRETGRPEVPVPGQAGTAPAELSGVPALAAR